MESSTKRRFLTDDNPGEDLAINDLKLAVYVAHLHLFAPKMAPLKYIRTLVDNTASEGWARRGSISSATDVGPLIREAAWITRQMHIHTSVKWITGLDNKEADANSRLAHLTVHNFLEHFRSTFPQPSP